MSGPTAATLPDTILVVDDHPTNLKLVAEVLQFVGYRVLQAPDAETALDLIARTPPALILMDVALPGMDGLELARRLKGDPKTQHIRIVALTASVMRGDEESARAAGCDGWLPKPIDTRNLPSQVAAFLSGAPQNNPRRVLIAEDNASSRKLLRVTLEAEGFSVMETADGAEALRLLEFEQVDAVIADILMPNIDGFRLCYEIRGSQRLHKLPVIIYTNTYTAPGDEQAALQMGADKYLRKPASAAVLVAALREAAARAPTPTPRHIPPEEDVDLLKLYSSRLVAKLEERNRELAEQTAALQKSEATLRLAQLIGHVGSWNVDLITNTMEWSEQTFRIFGREPGDYQPSNDAFFEAVHPEDRERVRTVAREALAGERTYQVEHRIVRPDGSVGHVIERAQLLRDARGGPWRLVGTVHDITERVQAEESRRSLEAQLRQSQKLEAIGTLAGGIAHDFNNILGVIVMNAAMAQTAAASNPAALQRIGEVLAASRRAADLVQQILTFSRKQDQQRQPVQLDRIVRDVLRLLTATLPPNIEIRATVPAATRTVLADATQIHQVLLNLCTNAWHAIGEQGGYIDVTLADFDVSPELARARPDLRPGSYVRLRVTDTGCGMERATLERIFEPFFTTKPVGKGTGLGLAVVHGIMKGHESAIFVESEPGHGTTFDLYFPEHPADAPSVPHPAEPTPKGEGQHILLVEDNQRMQLATGQVLESLGYRVTAHLSTEEAVNAFRAQPEEFDLVLTDFSMPVMNGAELARKLTALRPDLPVVIMSGYRLPREREFLLQTGVCDVLMKPFLPEKLAQSIHSALGAK